MTRRDMLRRAVCGAGAMALSGCSGRAQGAEAEARHPPIGAFTEIEGLRVHYAEKGEGPPVVLIHGASGNLRDFTFSMTDALAARGFRAIAFDRPGFGYTDRPKALGEEPTTQARILAAAARAIGADRAIVAGHSYGGAVAMAWALDAPEQVRAALSIAGATYPWGGDAGLLYSLGASDVFGGLTRFAARMLVDETDPKDAIARVFAPDAPPSGYAGYIGVGLALRPETFRANARDLDRLNDALKPQAARYGDLAMPVEAIHGEADRTVWAEVHSAPLAEAAQNGRLTLLPGVGHMPHHAKQAEVIAAVERLAAASAAG